MTEAHTEAAAELLHDRLELLRLRTLLVGAMGIVGLVVGLLALVGYGGQALKLVGQAVVANTDGFHVPSNLFQMQTDEVWARRPVLLQIAFVVIGISGVSYMTRQVLSALQERFWLMVLFGLALWISYMQLDLGSIWHSSQRDLVNAVRAKEWTRVEQLSLESRNPVGHRYVMAQVGLAKRDATLLQTHGKPLVDELDDMLMRRGLDPTEMNYGLLRISDEFDPHILRDIDVAVYGAPYTQIGLSFKQSVRTETQSKVSKVWQIARALLSTAVAVVGMIGAFALLKLWRRMSRRLRWLRPWVMAVG